MLLTSFLWVQMLERMDRTNCVLMVFAHDVNAVLRIASRLVILANRTTHLFEHVLEALDSSAFRAAFGSSVSIEPTKRGTWIHPNFG